jgi:hypothetical protein
MGFICHHFLAVVVQTWVWSKDTIQGFPTWPKTGLAVENMKAPKAVLVLSRGTHNMFCVKGYFLGKYWKYLCLDAI